jgi:predicted lysophospholipase L1 biosynthesis ABC-type transport system permease subunit
MITALAIVLLLAAVLDLWHAIRIGKELRRLEASMEWWKALGANREEERN